jgi:hypothetical protein
MIDQTAPLVSLLDSVSKPLGDLLGPDLTYLINLGYGDGEHGYSDAPANVATPFGLFPDVSFGDVLTHLGDGLKDGMNAMMADMESDASGSASDAAAGGGDTADGTLSSFTDVVNAFSGALSSAYAVLLPTADIVNALVTTLPTYDLSLFTDNLGDGDLLDALGLPVAATTGLATLALGFEADAFLNAFESISDDFSGVF